MLILKKVTFSIFAICIYAMGANADDDCNLCSTADQHIANFKSLNVPKNPTVGHIRRSQILFENVGKFIANMPLKPGDHKLTQKQIDKLSQLLTEVHNKDFTTVQFQLLIEKSPDVFKANSAEISKQLRNLNAKNAAIVIDLINEKMTELFPQAPAAARPRQGGRPSAAANVPSS